MQCEQCEMLKKAADTLLQRWDETEPGLKRQIIAALVMRQQDRIACLEAAMRNIDEACPTEDPGEFVPCSNADDDWTHGYMTGKFIVAGIVRNALALLQ